MHSCSNNEDVLISLLQYIDDDFFTLCTSSLFFAVISIVNLFIRDLYKGIDIGQAEF